MTRSPVAESARAEIVLPCDDLDATLAYFTERLGFRLDMVFPADAPRIAALSGHGLSIRLDAGLPPGDTGLRLPKGGNFEPDGRAARAPNGVFVEPLVIDTPPDPKVNLDSPIVSHPGESGGFGAGRAGMQYRDLLPGRLGGALIASHIRIPGGGPVADYVHYHDVGFQVLYCLEGTAQLLYEDQGAAFEMRAGDAIVQPPGLRHRVLECSRGFEVVEFSSPAEHLTRVDHDLKLPNAERSDGMRDGQRFLHARGGSRPWSLDDHAPWSSKPTAVREATGRRAALATLRSAGAKALSYPPPGAFVVGYVLRGSALLDLDAFGRHTIERGSAFAVAGSTTLAYDELSSDFSWLVLDVY